MLFDVYGANAGFQWLGLFMVLGALILLNEFARRTKAGGIFMFIGVCAAMTVYCVVVEIGAAMGAEWALNNPTYQTMGGRFHYAKVYAATAGCIGFMMLKYSWGKIGHIGSRRSRSLSLRSISSLQSQAISRVRSWHGIPAS